MIIAGLVLVLLGVAVAGVGVWRQSRVAPTPTIVTDDGSIKWIMDAPILLGSNRPDGLWIDAIHFLARNKSESPLHDPDARITPEMTRKEKLLDIYVNGQKLAGRPIPPRTDFELRIEVGLLAKDLLADFGGMQFVFRWDTGSTFARHLKLSDIEREVDALHKIAPAAVAARPPEPKRYTAYEKEQRLRAVDEIYGVFSTKLSPAFVEGRDLFNGLKNEVAQGTAPASKKLREHYAAVESAFNELNSLRKKYGYFSDIVAITTQNTFNGLAELVACDNLITEISFLENTVPNNIGKILDRDVVWMEARTANRDFEKFLDDTMPILKQKRAEIENTPIYEVAK